MVHASNLAPALRAKRPPPPHAEHVLSIEDSMQLLWQQVLPYQALPDRFEDRVEVAHVGAGGPLDGVVRNQGHIIHMKNAQVACPR